MHSIPLIVIALVVSLLAKSQTDSSLVVRSKLFHLALVKNPGNVSSFLDDQLSYGHSNGWLETKTQMQSNLNAGIMVYNQFFEDSIEAQSSGDVGYIRFFASINGILNGKPASFKLKVLEVWRRQNDDWILYARQAIRAL